MADLLLESLFPLGVPFLLGFEGLGSEGHVEALALPLGILEVPGERPEGGIGVRDPGGHGIERLGRLATSWNLGGGEGLGCEGLALRGGGRGRGRQGAEVRRHLSDACPVPGHRIIPPDGGGAAEGLEGLREMPLRIVHPAEDLERLRHAHGLAEEGLEELERLPQLGARVGKASLLQADAAEISVYVSSKPQSEIPIAGPETLQVLQTFQGHLRGLVQAPKCLQGQRDALEAVGHRRASPIPLQANVRRAAAETDAVFVISATRFVF